MYLVLLLPDIAGAARLLGHSYDNANGRDDHHHGLEPEEPLELMWPGPVSICRNAVTV